MASQVMTNAENNQNDDGDGVNSDQECATMGHIICDLNSSDNDDVIYQEYEEQYRQVFHSLSCDKELFKVLTLQKKRLHALFGVFWRWF